jgi:hypothetical protein
MLGRVGRGLGASAIVTLGLLAACGGPAASPWFDEQCQEAARFFEDQTGMEASTAEDIECQEIRDARPARCIRFGLTLDSIVGTAIFADGVMETFDWMPGQR